MANRDTVNLAVLAIPMDDGGSGTGRAMGQDASGKSDPEAEAMAKVWIEEHWGLEWPDGVAPEAVAGVLRLMARLRDALDGARSRDRARGS